VATPQLHPPIGTFATPTVSTAEDLYTNPVDCSWNYFFETTVEKHGIVDHGCSVP